jgi:hypothetical protein
MEMCNQYHALTVGPPERLYRPQNWSGCVDEQENLVSVSQHTILASQAQSSTE